MYVFYEIKRSPHRESGKERIHRNLTIYIKYLFFEIYRYGITCILPDIYTPIVI